jgi:hypothetical protein
MKKNNDALLLRNKAKEDEEAKKADDKAAQNQPNLLANNLQNPIYVSSNGSPINMGSNPDNNIPDPNALSGANLIFFMDNKLDKLLKDGSTPDDLLLSS